MIVKAFTPEPIKLPVKWVNTRHLVDDMDEIVHGGNLPICFFYIERDRRVSASGNLNRQVKLFFVDERTGMPINANSVLIAGGFRKVSGKIQGYVTTGSEYDMKRTLETWLADVFNYSGPISLTEFE